MGPAKSRYVIPKKNPVDHCSPSGHCAATSHCLVLPFRPRSLIFEMWPRVSGVNWSLSDVHGPSRHV